MKVYKTLLSQAFLDRQVDGRTISEQITDGSSFVCIGDVELEIAGAAHSAIVGAVNLVLVAKDTYSILLPNPDLVASEEFASIASRYDGIFMNNETASEMRGTDGDGCLVKHCCRLSYLTSYQKSFAIMQADRGMMFLADERAHDRLAYRVLKPPVPFTEDYALATYAAAWAIGRHWLGLSIDDAITYAVEAAAKIVSGRKPYPA